MELPLRLITMVGRKLLRDYILRWVGGNFLVDAEQPEPLSEEVRRRLPRVLLRSVIVAIILFVAYLAVPLMHITTSLGFPLPSLGLLGTFVVAFFIVIVFLLALRILTDVKVLLDAGAVYFAEWLPGIKGHRLPAIRRAFMEIGYAIFIVLVIGFLSPLIATLPGLSIIVSVLPFVGLAVVILLVWDAGRILYRELEERVVEISEHIATELERRKRW
jgi:hypothetical protein